MARSRDKRKGRRRERHHGGPVAANRPDSDGHQSDTTSTDKAHDAAVVGGSDGSQSETASADNDEGRTDTSGASSDKIDKRAADTAASAEAAATRPPTGKPQPASERVRRRTLRLSPRTNAMAERLAAVRGIDVNATIAVAIAEDYFRLFGTGVE